MARMAVATRRAIVAAALMTVAVATDSIVSAQPVPQPTYYVVTQTPGPAWKAGVDFRNQPLADHFQYWSHLQSGPLVIGGPLLDGSGGMIILDVPSADAARAIAAADPAVRTGLLIATVRPWQIVLRGARGTAPPGS